MDFAVQADHKKNIKENEKRDKYMDSSRELKKLLNMNVTVIPIVIGALGMISKGLVKKTEGVWNRKKSRDHPNYSIVKVGQNTEKSPGDLKKLAIT